MNVLHAGRAFDFNDVPMIPPDRVKNVGTGITTIVLKSGFKQRLPELSRLPGGVKHFVEIRHAACDFDSFLKKPFGKLADLGALVEDRLGLFTGLGNLVFSVVTKPQQLRTLEAIQKRELGNKYLAS